MACMNDEDVSASAPAEAENIAVCIRVRPMNEREKRCRDAYALCCMPSLNVVSLTDPETGALLSGKGNVFQYDEIFDASSDAHAIYERVGRRIVRSTLGGINGTIFAYGQTSSGKTYTMQGDGGMPFQPEAETSHPGLLQLAVEDIFQFIETCGDRDFLLRVSFLEIYNEVVKDLLNPTEKGANLKLREDPRKGVYVECREKIITDYEDIVTLLQTGNQNRTVGQTAMNEKSSRSHSVFRIVIESKEKKAESRRLSEEDVNGAVLVASLNLVDLAGSESLRHTGAEGIRQREAGNINKSLLTLARVINALATPGGAGQNAPFRDSKLTRLLQNSLGGNTRTLIICCVTPSDRFIEETKSTLQFAARAKDIKTSATVNEVLDDQTQLRRLKREVHQLRKLTNSETLSALKAENEALLSEKNHNRSEIARLMGLIVSSTSVAKANTKNKEGRWRRKRMRETWGPGDFPATLLRSQEYPHKRHSPAKENRDPQTPFCTPEDVDENPAKTDNLAIKLSPSKSKSKQTGLDTSSNKLLHLFSAVFQSYHDEKGEDPIAAVETIANEKLASLDDMERTPVLDVLASIKSLMMANVQSKHVMDENQKLKHQVKDLRLKLESVEFGNQCASRVDIVTDKVKSELDLTHESLNQAKARCRELEVEKTNSQLMAAEEMNLLRYELEKVRIESKDLRQRFEREKLELVAVVKTLRLGLSLDKNGNLLGPCRTSEGLEPIMEDGNASPMVHSTIDEEIVALKSQEKTQSQIGPECRVKIVDKERMELPETTDVLRDTVSSSSDRDIKSQENVSARDQCERAVVNALAGELQNIMQELAQLQSDHEAAALEKAELQAATNRMGEELESTLHQMCKMSEKLMEKEHQAKVLQAQLDAKLMTISQMQTKHDNDVSRLQQLIQDLTIQNDELVKTRDNAMEATTVLDEVDARENANEDCQEVDGDQVVRLEEVPSPNKESFNVDESMQGSLRTSQLPPGQDELQIAFEQLQADFLRLQQEKNDLATMLVDRQEVSAEDSITNDKNVESADKLEQRYHSLKEDFKRVSEELEHVSCERNNCLDELRALESQLMEVSDEKMRLVVAVDELESKLCEAQQKVLSSTSTISMLQAKVEAIQSEKATVEASRTEIEQNMTTLQAEYAAMREQVQDRESDNENGATEAKRLHQQLETESKEREKLQLDIQSYEETLSVLRKEAKHSSDTMLELREQLKVLETDLNVSMRTLEKKDKELSKLTSALARLEEENEEMRLQSKQRLVVAERKEIALQEKICELEEQVKTLLTDKTDHVELSRIEAKAKAKESELESEVKALENQLTATEQEMQHQTEVWNDKLASAERKAACLRVENSQLGGEVSRLRNEVETSRQANEATAEELRQTQESCSVLLEQEEMMQRELEAANALWAEKQQDLTCQMDSLREKLHEAQRKLKRYEEIANGEGESVIEEEGSEFQQDIEVDDEHLSKRKENQGEGQRDDVEEKLLNRINQLQENYVTAQTQQAAYKAKLKTMETQLEMTENEVLHYRRELKSLAESLKTAKMEASTYHDKLVEAQLAKETMEDLIAKQKARIEKLDKVKMTTETLELFRTLKKARFDLQVKVSSLQKDLAQARAVLAQSTRK